MKTTLLNLTVLSLLGLAACSPESNTLATAQPITVPPRKADVKVSTTPLTWVTLDGGQNQMEFNPQVDIVFVIDNSDSMKAAEANLVKNTDRFADGIVRNKVIDYHIGVVSTWDNTERYLKSPARNDGYQAGDLRFVKDSKGQKYNQRFLTRKEDKGLLASTLKLGVLSYEEGGPEVEEFFSPLASALDKTGRGATNEGFFRDEAQLVVVFLTDADDASQMSPDEMAAKLLAFKGGRKDKVSVYGALVRKSDPDSVKDWGFRRVKKYHPECFAKNPPIECKTGFGPERLERMINLVNGTSAGIADEKNKFIMKITSPKFGEDLAKIGNDITVKILDKTIALGDQWPVVDPKTGELMLRVRYGTPEELAQGKGAIIPRALKGGWTYSSDTNSIKFDTDIKAYETAKEGSRFAVDMIPVPM